MSTPACDPHPNLRTTCKWVLNNAFSKEAPPSSQRHLGCNWGIMLTNWSKMQLNELKASDYYHLHECYHNLVTATTILLCVLVQGQARGYGQHITHFFASTHMGPWFSLGHCDPTDGHISNPRSVGPLWAARKWSEVSISSILSLTSRRGLRSIYWSTKYCHKKSCVCGPVGW